MGQQGRKEWVWGQEVGLKWVPEGQRVRYLGIQIGFQLPTEANFGKFMLTIVTPLWTKCEGEAHTPKSGNLESSGTPKNSKLELKGQNTSHWSVLGVIEKVLKYRCLN
jgi:hypothetical protein